MNFYVRVWRILGLVCLLESPYTFVTAVDWSASDTPDQFVFLASVKDLRSETVPEGKERLNRTIALRALSMNELRKQRLNNNYYVNVGVNGVHQDPNIFLKYVKGIPNGPWKDPKGSLRDIKRILKRR